MYFRKNIRKALKHPSVYLGLAGIIAATAAQLDNPLKTYGLLIACAFSIMGTLLKSPLEEPDAPIRKKKKQGGNDGGCN